MRKGCNACFCLCFLNFCNETQPPSPRAQSFSQAVLWLSMAQSGTCHFGGHMVMLHPGATAVTSPWHRGIWGGGFGWRRVLLWVLFALTHTAGAEGWEWGVGVGKGRQCVVWKGLSTRMCLLHESASHKWNKDLEMEPSCASLSRSFLHPCIGQRALP